MEFRVLGSLEVVGADGPVEIRAAKPRALLAILLMNANRVMAADALIDALWPVPPASAAKVLQTYVSQLRRLLGAERIATSGAGYALRIDRGELDSARFEELSAAGRSTLADGSAAVARRALANALDLWRGPAYAD